MSHPIVAEIKPPPDGRKRHSEDDKIINRPGGGSVLWTDLTVSHYVFPLN